MDYEVVDGNTPESFNTYLKKHKLNPSVILQNATFVPRFFPYRHTLMYLQDNLRAMGTATSQQESNLRYADCLVTNTIDTAAAYPEYDFWVCPVGVDSSLFLPMSKNTVRAKYGINEFEKIGIFEEFLRKCHTKCMKMIKK